MPTNPEDPEDDVTAAELALGVIEGEERAAALRRVLSDPAFAYRVELWRAHLGKMFSESRSVTPPRRLFARIEAELTPRRRRRLLWPVIAGALAASLVFVLLLRPAPMAGPTASGPALVAMLDPATKGAPVPAIYDRVRGEIRIAHGAGIAGRSAELWMIGQDGLPHALGLLTGKNKSVVTVASADRSAMVPGTKLAISSEPEGGSPTGKPTGPILAIGAFISV